MGRRGWPIAIIVAALVLVPTAVLAAIGSFSSSTATTALTATATGAGRAMTATSNTNNTAVFTNKATSGAWMTLYANQFSPSTSAAAVFGYAVNSGTGGPIGVYGRSNASAGRGVLGIAAKTLGTNYGVVGLANGDQGTGVLGSGNLAGLLGSAFFGVVGDSPAIGDGSYGLWSLTDVGISGHLMAGGGDIAGTCDVVAGTTALCSFPHAFPTAPLVVLTPQGDPGGAYWVTSTTTGFTIHLANTGTVTFNYMAIGIDTNISAAALHGTPVRAASAAKARAAR